MRLTELTGKEVINLGDGGRLGIIDDCEILFDPRNGRIQALVLNNRSRFFNFFGSGRPSNIPWQAIKRIGDEVIIVDTTNMYDRVYAGLRDR